MNRLEVLGRNGIDPILKYTANGMAILELRIADNKRKKDGGVHTQWFKVVVFGKMAENLSGVIKKGTEVWACGEYEIRKVESENDTKYFHQLNASYVRACVGKGDATSDQDDNPL